MNAQQEINRADVVEGAPEEIKLPVADLVSLANAGADTYKTSAIHNSIVTELSSRIGGLPLERGSYGWDMAAKDTADIIQKLTKNPPNQESDVAQIVDNMPGQPSASKLAMINAIYAAYVKSKRHEADVRRLAAQGEDRARALFIAVENGDLAMVKALLTDDQGQFYTVPPALMISNFPQLLRIAVTGKNQAGDQRMTGHPNPTIVQALLQASASQHAQRIAYAPNTGVRDPISKDSHTNKELVREAGGEGQWLMVQALCGLPLTHREAVKRELKQDKPFENKAEGNIEFVPEPAPIEVDRVREEGAEEEERAVWRHQDEGIVEVSEGRSDEEEEDREDPLSYPFPPEREGRRESNSGLSEVAEGPADVPANLQKAIQQVIEQERRAAYTRERMRNAEIIGIGALMLCSAAAMGMVLQMAKSWVPFIQVIYDYGGEAMLTAFDRYKNAILVAGADIFVQGFDSALEHTSLHRTPAERVFAAKLGLDHIVHGLQKSDAQINQLTKKEAETQPALRFAIAELIEARIHYALMQGENKKDKKNNIERREELSRVDSVHSESAPDQQELSLAEEDAMEPLALLAAADGDTFTNEQLQQLIALRDQLKSNDPAKQALTSAQWQNIQLTYQKATDFKAPASYLESGVVKVAKAGIGAAVLGFGLYFFIESFSFNSELSSQVLERIEKIVGAPDGLDPISNVKWNADLAQLAGLTFGAMSGVGAALCFWMFSMALRRDTSSLENYEKSEQLLAQTRHHMTAEINRRKAEQPAEGWLDSKIQAVLPVGRLRFLAVPIAALLKFALYTMPNLWPLSLWDALAAGFNMFDIRLGHSWVNTGLKAVLALPLLVVTIPFGVLTGYPISRPKDLPAALEAKHCYREQLSGWPRLKENLKYYGKRLLGGNYELKSDQFQDFSWQSLFPGKRGWGWDALRLLATAAVLTIGFVPHSGSRTSMAIQTGRAIFSIAAIVVAAAVSGGLALIPLVAYLAITRGRKFAANTLSNDARIVVAAPPPVEMAVVPASAEASEIQADHSVVRSLSVSMELAAASRLGSPTPPSASPFTSSGGLVSRLEDFRAPRPLNGLSKPADEPAIVVGSLSSSSSVSSSSSSILSGLTKKPVPLPPVVEAKASTKKLAKVTKEHQPVYVLGSALRAHRAFILPNPSMSGMQKGEEAILAAACNKINTLMTMYDFSSAERFAETFQKTLLDDQNSSVVEQLAQLEEKLWKAWAVLDNSVPKKFTVEQLNAVYRSTFEGSPPLLQDNPDRNYRGLILEGGLFADKDQDLGVRFNEFFKVLEQKKAQFASAAAAVPTESKASTTAVVTTTTTSLSSSSSSGSNFSSSSSSPSPLPFGFGSGVSSSTSQSLAAARPPLTTVTSSLSASSSSLPPVVPAPRPSRPTPGPVLVLSREEQEFLAEGAALEEEREVGAQYQANFLQSRIVSKQALAEEKSADEALAIKVQQTYGLTLQPTTADGDCFFHGVSALLGVAEAKQEGIAISAPHLRLLTLRYMQANFQKYAPTLIEGENGDVAADFEARHVVLTEVQQRNQAEASNQQKVDAHVAAMLEGNAKRFADQTDMRALSDMLGVSIAVVGGSAGPVCTSQGTSVPQLFVHIDQRKKHYSALSGTSTDRDLDGKLTDAHQHPSQGTAATPAFIKNREASLRQISRLSLKDMKAGKFVFAADGSITYTPALVAEAKTANASSSPISLATAASIPGTGLFSSTTTASTALSSSSAPVVAPSATDKLPPLATLSR